MKLLLHIADGWTNERWVTRVGSIKVLGKFVVGIGDSHSVFRIVNPNRVVMDVIDASDSRTHGHQPMARF